MAKVVLVWNEHPTEVVAGFHARKAAKILREKYGHEVVVEKVPARETNYGILSEAKTSKQAFERLASLKSSIKIARKYAQRHKAPAFNFHASSATHQVKEIRIKEHQLNETPWGRETDIFLESDPNTNSYLIEVPGFWVDLPNRIRDPRGIKWAVRILEADKLRNKKRQLLVNRNLRVNYHLRRMPLNHPEQQKYLHPAISEKIAAAIHERITKRKP